MQRNKILKYLLDIQSIIKDIEKLQEFSENQFEQFQSNFIAVRAAERLLEIVGEAVNQIKKIDDSITIKNSNEIIGLRNKIVHAYDSIDPALLWGIIVHDIQPLKEDIERLREDQ
jgi:uncharacterized protein with HEPN domain